jgi:hypothetical protein
MSVGFLEDTMPPTSATQDESERVPIFGTWPRIYAAVILCALVVMGLIAVVSGWKY